MSRSRIDFGTHPPTDYDLEIFAQDRRADRNAVWVAEEVVGLRKKVESLGWEIAKLRHDEEDWEA